jgi:uncharacterized membrane protein YfcA
MHTLISRSRIGLLSLCMFILCIRLTSAGGFHCNSSQKTLYQCPNCGGINVTDCLKGCDGYFFEATQNGQNFCFDRVLFNEWNDTPNDHDDYYTYHWRNIIGGIIWFLTAGVAISCGIGGGGVYLPLGIIILKFSPSSASGLSQASVVGASVGGTLLNLRHVHPTEKIRNEPGIENDMKCNATINTTTSPTLSLLKPMTVEEEQVYSEMSSEGFYTRPLIPYHWLLYFCPMEIAGAALGVIIQTLFPVWLYLICAVLVLAFTASKTFQKFLLVRDEERLARQGKVLPDIDATAMDVDNDSNGTSIDHELIPREALSCRGNGDVRYFTSGNLPLIKISPDGETEIVEHIVEDDVTEDDDDETSNDSVDDVAVAEANSLMRKQYLEEDMVQFPMKKIAMLFVLWVVPFVLTLLKGGKGVDSLIGITCLSPLFGTFTVLQFVWLLSFAAYQAYILHRDQQRRMSVQYPFLSGDPIWTVQQLGQFGGFAFAAGFVAGFIGVSAGNFLAPFLFWKNIQPRVASAATATMIILTSSTVAIMYITAGLIPWSYALFYFCVTVCGAVFGKYNIDVFVKRTGRASVLIIILACVVSFGAIGCSLYLFTRLAAADWCLDGFNKFCSVSANAGECPASNRLLMEERLPFPNFFNQ